MNKKTRKGLVFVATLTVIVSVLIMYDYFTQPKSKRIREQGYRHDYKDITPSP
ncbi:unnamed protein product [Cylicocyclus nassatus]|uniref:Uncharacterized protein n=1 Tax=Cylicocyclus nassatus TaxID=53992 RepID=A0AA36M1P3_CYLNA|nr:unnamed protein product [Cylicocyclus nassatus]